MNTCQNCTLDLSLHLPIGDVCPNCGKKIGESQEKSEPASGQIGTIPVFSKFFKILHQLIFNPTMFFKENASALHSDEGTSSALTFAVLILWLATFINFIWKSLVSLLLQSRVADFFQISGDVFDTPFGTHQVQLLGGGLDVIRGRMIEFLIGTGSIVLAPFTALIKLLIFAAFIHLAVKLFFKTVADSPPKYSTTLKIICFATAPWVFCIVPGFGMLIAMVLEFVISVIGLREVYKNSNKRAVFAVLFPELLVFLMFFMIFIFIILVIFVFLKNALF